MNDEVERASRVRSNWLCCAAHPDLARGPHQEASTDGQSGAGARTDRLSPESSAQLHKDMHILPANNSAPLPLPQ